MTVYVDNARNRYRGMLMSHLIADTPEELADMARQLGLKPEWLQYAETDAEHYDISDSKRREALRLGVVSVSSRELVRILRSRRASGGET